MKFWQNVLDMKWKYIWWFYMVFAATLFFNNTFGSSSLGLFWLSKSVFYMFCFIFASVRLAKWWKKPITATTRIPNRIHPTIRPFVRIPRSSSHATSGAIKIRGYSDDVDVWRSDFDSRTDKIIKRTERNIQKIKDNAKKIEKRNRIKRDEWDTRYFD